MKKNYTITNDTALDATKDSFTPPKAGEVSEDTVIELFERLEINLQYFYDYVHKNSEYYTDKGVKSYLLKDIARVIRHLFNIENIKRVKLQITNKDK